MPIINHALKRATIGVNTQTHQGGYTIIELMIAVTLGLLLLAGLTTVFVQNNQSSNEIERANQQAENGRYAMQLLTYDLSNAGYLVEFNPTALTTPTAKPDPCLTAVSDLKSALPLSIQGYDSDNAASTPTCISSDLRLGTDILVVRRASNCAVGDTGCDAVVSGAPYFQASTCGSATELSSSNIANYYALDTNTANLTLHKKDCNPPTVTGTVAPYHQYLTHIYFIANNDKTGDGIPTLKRAELGSSGFTIVPLVEGIENLQIEYGIDGINTDGTVAATKTGSPAMFTADPDSLHSCNAASSPTCTFYWRNTVATKIYLLARNLTTTAGYSDNKTYYLGLKADGTTANTVSSSSDAVAYPSAYKRHVYTSVVRLNNVAGRNTP
ncbi:PilW family protein [Tolumonas lignilytica]|uniref:PilW family protein n=1 Tax=Tolumonas lignilytica TaxID=1283284 RepID=UPI0009E011C1|nr:PilW family protein [Tolumonas lignilytica]